MIQRMNLEAVYHEQAFLDIMAILSKYKIKDCCMGVSTSSKSNEEEEK